MTDLNQLRAACEHGKWERHATYVAKDGSEKFVPWHVAAEITDGSAGDCPGGRVLNQAIIIERDTDGNWPQWALKAAGYHYSSQFTLDALASAQEESQGLKFADIDPPSFFKENQP